MKHSIHRLTSVIGAFSITLRPNVGLQPQRRAVEQAGSANQPHGRVRFHWRQWQPQPGHQRPAVSEPGDGVTYDRFADDALYSINIASPASGGLLRSYNFRFSPVSSSAGNYKNLNTALSYGRGTTVGAIQTVGDSSQNFTQTYSVTMVDVATQVPRCWGQA